MANPKKLVSFIWKFVALQRWKFISIFLLSLVWSLDATVWPYLLRLLIDTFTQYDGDRAAAWSSLKWILLGAVSLWVLVEAGFRGRNFLLARFFPKLEADIRMAMFDHIQHHSPKYFNEHFAGSLSNKMSDMTTQVTSLIENMMLFIPAIVTSILSIIFFYEIGGVFALILGGWIFIHLSICFAFTKKCAAYSNIHGEARSVLAGKVVDSFTSNFTVNLFHRFRFEKSRIAEYQNDERSKNFRAQQYISWMFLWLSVIFLVGVVILTALIVLRWMQEGITTGEVIQIFNTTWNVIMILWFAGEVIPRFFQSIGIATQALSVMNDPQDVLDVPHAKPLLVSEGEIIFENVSFCYGEKKLFQNKAVHIRAGEKVGLVGYSGAGKSTFVNLILRFYPVEQGKILIDGQDIAEVTLESLRRQVALIPQDPLLFHRSLEDNIRYGRMDASDDEVREVAVLAHCDEFIKRCHAGYASLVGERGTKLSGGERQRIAIARAMLTKAPILILDEATSALDSVTEKYIQESLESLMHNRTTLVVAHRLSTLAKMDRILVFDQGKIVEQGSHTELLSRGGHYARMWKMQAGGFLPESGQG
jgi:ATP-binding cassette subfamily B protein